MINLLEFLLLFIVFGNLNFSQEVKCAEEALVFNYITQQLVAPKENKDSNGVPLYDGTHCIFACPPALNEWEKNLINKEGSITGNGTFLKYIYENEVFLKTTKICIEPFKPTTVFSKSTNAIKTGYEFFYKDDTIPFLYLKENDQLTKVYGEDTDKEKKLNDTHLVQRIDEHETTKFQTVNSNSKWVHFWIPVLSIKGSEARRQISYTTDYIGDNSKLSNKFFEVCEVITLGDETKNMTSRKKIEGLLKMANQTTSTENPLQITQIMPLHYFHTLSARLATCTELNLALMWDSIATGAYKKVDMYLYALYRAWPSKVNIIFGVYGSIMTNFNNTTDTSILKNYTLPVPEILYRIVEYRKGLSTLNVIIVIHNNADSYVPENKRICTVDDEVSGWDGMKVTNNSLPSHYIGRAYACPVTKDIIKILQADYEVTDLMEPFVLDADKQNRITVDGPIVCTKEMVITEGGTMYYRKVYL